MPRGVRKSIEDQISDIDNQIASLQEKRKELIAAQEQDAMNELLDAAKAAGKSPKELVQMLKQSNII